MNDKPPVVAILITAIFLGISIGLAFTCGYSVCQDTYKHELIEKGLARYNPVNAQFELLVDVEENFEPQD